MSFLERRPSGQYHLVFRFGRQRFRRDRRAFSGHIAVEYLKYDHAWPPPLIRTALGKFCGLLVVPSRQAHVNLPIAISLA
jgi:hypothetical protein